MNLLLSLSKLKRSPKMACIRQYTNLLYYNPSFVNIDTKDFDVIEVDGCRFYVTDQINSIQRVKSNSWFEGVRSTDVVVDIGANIGAITIPLAKVAKRVYAVEPLFWEELEANIKLNKLENVTTLKRYVGRNGKETKVIKFASKKAKALGISFETLKETIGVQIDFLKMDGEGCEWSINPSELEGIRELRIEFHIRRGEVRECKRKYKEYLDWMKAKGYKVYAEHPRYGPDPYDKEDYNVRAILGGKE